MRGSAPSRRIVATLLAAVCVGAFATSPTRAQDKEISGWVLGIDAGDVVLDLGKKHGVSDGDVLDVWRPLKLKHPVTGKVVTDRFKIGSLKITQAREVMSLARPNGPLARNVEPGDFVNVPGAGTTKPAPSAKPLTSAKPTSSAPSSPTTTVVDADPEARALGALFDSLAGAPPEARAKAYEDWIKANPKSRFAGVLQEEALALRGALAQSGAPGAPPSAPKPSIAAMSWKKPDEALEGAPLTLGFELSGPVAGAVLHVRAADEPAFSPFPLVAQGEGYWSVVVPKDRVRAPSLWWFLEAVSTDGKTVSVLGGASDAMVTRVVSAPSAAEPLSHSNVFSLWTDYADYNRLKGNDFAWQTEGFFGMRFGDVGVRAVRSGFGVYRGKGGSVAELDHPVSPRDPRSVGLSYGYVEGEIGIDAFWGIVARAVAGLGNTEVKGGGQAFVRIGNDKKTNLLLGGEFLGGIGLRGISQLELATFPRFPILVRSEVTNQPAGERAFSGATPPGAPRVSTATGDIGVRAIVQGGYRFMPGFVFFVRVSYQGRTIHHAGPGVGAGMTFEW